MAGVLGHCRVRMFLQQSTLRQEMERAVSRRKVGNRWMSSSADVEAAKAEAVRQQLEAAAREDRLDLLTAARILFSTPQKPRKFGLDFHLWQFFVACLPPFAVYLTAQYARSEMRRMEKERDLKKEAALQAAEAEKQASHLANEGKIGEEQSSKSDIRSESPVVQQEHKEVPKLNSKDDPVTAVSGKELMTMKARLDAMEDKLKILESIRPGTTFVIPIGSEPRDSKESGENVQKSAAQKADSAGIGKDVEGKPQKQRLDGSPLVQQNQKDQVSQESK